MKLDEITLSMEPVSVSGGTDIEIKGIAVDSRRVRDGFLFAAVPGLKHDGADFIDDALKRGAVAVVSEKRHGLGNRCVEIQVSDVRSALARAAAVFHGDPSKKLKIFGVTGTNGKTTTSFMIRNILRSAGMKPGMIGTVHYEIGERVIPSERTTPGPVELQGLLGKMVEIECDSAVMEVSSHAILQKRVHSVSFDTGIFTNLTQDHLDYHHSMEEYFAVKAGFLVALKDSGKNSAAIINSDDEYGRRLLAMPEISVDKLSFGERPDAMVRAARTSVDTAGSHVAVQSPWGASEIRLRMPGRFNVSNALAAFTACAAAGVELDVISGALSAITSVPGRLEHFTSSAGFDVFIDYAHTADALKNVLVTLRELTFGKLTVVFGCGGDRDRTKRPHMGRIATELADRVVVTSDNPRTEPVDAIIENIIEGCVEGPEVVVLPDRHEAIIRALSEAGSGDIVLVAGKGHENYQDFGNRVAPFDDKQVVLEYLSGPGGKKQ